MAKKSRTRVWIIVLIALLIVLALGGLWLRTQRTGQAYEEETVRTGTLETYYSFSGNVITKNSQTLAAKGNFTIRDLYVSADARVSPGDALVRLSNGDILRADIQGEVTDVLVSVGDSVAAGTQLMRIVDFDNLEILIKVDEFDVKAIRAGQEAVVTVNALGLSEVATIEHISKQAVSVGDINYYEAKLNAPQDARVLPGMKVDARVLNQRAEGAALISMNALQFDAYNQPYVYVRGDGRQPVTRKVSVGLQDGVSAQILSGLQAGEVALVPQSPATLMFGRMR